MSSVSCDSNSSVFKASAELSVSVPQSTIWDLDGGFLLVQLLKVFVVLTKSRSMDARSLGMNLDYHKQLLWSHRPGLLPPCHLSIVSSSSLGSSHSSSQKAGALVTPLHLALLQLCLGPSKGRRGRESNKARPILLGPQLHQSEKNFGSCKLPLPPSWDFLEAGVYWNEEKQKQKRISHNVSYSIFLPLEFKLEGFSWF